MPKFNAEHRSARSAQAELPAQAKAVESQRHGALTQLAADIAGSPRMIAQRAQLKGLATPKRGKKEKVPLQGKFIAQLAKPPRKKNALQKHAMPGGAGGLPPQLKSGIESLSGHSMDDVQVHYNSSLPAQLQAHAYAQGSSIHLGPGQEQHLPHEAWHVVQQKQGRVKPTLQAKGIAINDNPGLEREADVMGARAARITQLKCAECDKKAPAQRYGAGIVQRVVCNATDRGGEQLHDYVVNHLAGAKNWQKEYHVKNAVGADRYADLVTPAATKVYEVKSTGVGAATAKAEATLYAAWMTATCGTAVTPGIWSGREEFDMGDLGKACIKGHGAGGITYQRDEDQQADCTVVIP